MDIHIRYYHPGLNIGLADLKSVWLLTEVPVQLLVTVYRGSLVYRVPVTRRRISYRVRKKGLIKNSSCSGCPISACRFSDLCRPVT